MTIHKSKGLEFPVVFIPKCNYKPGESFSDKALVRLNPKTKLGVMRHDRQKLYRYKTLQYAGTTVQNAYDEVSEELRVLYVAMTRAKEKMIFVISATSNIKAKMFLL
jgi:ATP-dependent exoDNAse (exonuclease V) beta subunit